MEKELKDLIRKHGVGDVLESIRNLLLDSGDIDHQTAGEWVDLAIDNLGEKELEV